MKVILCCAQGISSFVLKRKLEKYVSLKGLNIQFIIGVVDHIMYTDTSFEVMLLGPQVRYQFDELKQKYSTKQIIEIPNDIFLEMDAEKIINLFYKK